MAVETDTTFHKWLSDFFKQSVIVIKSRTIVKCSERHLIGSLINKVAPEFKKKA